MKIAAHILAYNVDRFIGAVLKNLENQVDKIYVAYPTRPWGYTPIVRETNSNPTQLSFILNLAESINCPVEIIQGDWLTEDEMRNECLSKARKEGFDWFIIQDADEFYTESTWEIIKKNLIINKSYDHIVTTWYNFWKTSQYVMTYKDGGIKGTNAGFAIRCNSDIKFIRKRICNNSLRKVIDCTCYHYGYVMSDNQMLEKISTWGHSNELFAKNWYNYKWKNWEESTKYLHPIHPDEWINAIRFPFEQPSFSSDFDLPIDYNNKVGFDEYLGEILYDFKAKSHFGVKKFKKVAKIILNN